jgi:hypothetical protein
LPRILHLDRKRTFVHIVATTHGESALYGKARLILAAVMSAIMVFIVTPLVTFLNL